jgi:flavodoxin
MIIYSFLDDYDLSGKTIVPFCTSGGSGFSGSLNTIRSLEPEATLLEGLSLGSSQASNPSDAVSNWLDTNGIER